MLMAVVLCFSVVSVASAQDSSIGVICNGRAISFDVNPQIVNGRTLVPMRKIFEEMGATVNYDASSKTITAKKGEKVVAMKVGSTTISVSGTASTIDVAPTIIDSRTLVPVRAVSESLNATVEWNDALHKVIIFDWDNITKTVPYETCAAIPDFGKYVGLDSSVDGPSAGGNHFLVNYSYANLLGTNKLSILEDYKKVLEKNGFQLDDTITSDVNFGPAYVKSEEDESNYYTVGLPTDLNSDNFIVSITYKYAAATDTE